MKSSFLNSNKLKTPVLRFYNWDRPAVSIGYFQKFNVELDQRYTLVRRPTGGGTVIHGNDITYSMTFPLDYQILKMKRQESYKIISQSIINGLMRLDFTTEEIKMVTGHTENN